MAKTSIVAYEVLTPLGDLKQSVRAIKEQKDALKTKNGTLFYPLKNPISQNQNEIYKALETLCKKLLKNLDKNKREKTAIIVGTSVIDWHLVDAINSVVYEYKKTPFYSQKTSIDSYAQNLSLEFGLSGFSTTINTACTSSANALLEASNLLACRACEFCLVLGFEVYSPLMSDGFAKMELISKSTIKPLDKNRDGLILGEGFGGVLLGSGDEKWSFLGGATSCNSATITAVSENGDECVEVMQEALKNTSLHADDIDILKAHATGSLSNDVAEANAIQRVFDKVDICAIKPYVGHSIGACGVIEMVLLMGCVDDGFAPKAKNFETPIMQKSTPLSKNKECKSGTFMCNYFGFGGNNVSFVVQKDKK